MGGPPSPESAGAADELRAGPDVTEIDDRADGRVPWRVFMVIGVFVLASAVLYGFTSGEEAGTAMLVGAAALSLWSGLFLFRTAQRSAPGGVADHGRGDTHQAMYLPEASPWPVGIGLGLTLVLNGLLIGTWFLVPGAMVLAVSLAGFAQQSRHRR